MRRELASILLIVLLVGCGRDDMADQPKARPYRQTEFFADGTTARPLVPGTVARGQVMAKTVSENATDYPFPVSYAELKRGQERYDIYCAVCHARSGEGDGMIVQRGFTKPPAFFPMREHQARYPELYPREQALLNAAPGHIVNVIANGYGAMYSYADRVSVEDRWRIAAYIKALQLSRSLKLNDLPPEDRAKLATTQPATQSGGSFE